MRLDPLDVTGFWDKCLESLAVNSPTGSWAGIPKSRFRQVPLRGESGPVHDLPSVGFFPMDGWNTVKIDLHHCRENLAHKVNDWHRASLYLMPQDRRKVARNLFGIPLEGSASGPFGLRVEADEFIREFLFVFSRHYVGQLACFEKVSFPKSCTGRWASFKQAKKILPDYILLAAAEVIEIFPSQHVARLDGCQTLGNFMRKRKEISLCDLLKIAEMKSTLLDEEEYAVL
jgi:hypothetical protein